MKVRRYVDSHGAIGVSVDRDLKSGRVDLIEMDPDEMIDLASDLLATALAVKRRKALS